MAGQRHFRFGVINETPLPASKWTDRVRRAEELGYSTLLIRDHFVPDFFGDQFAPLSALMAAASVTNTLRIGTLVLDNDYRHPVMLAKEAATIDMLSGGRLELGIGAGWLQREYDVAGLKFEPAGQRIERLQESLRILRGLFADGSFSFTGKHYAIDELDGFPKPAQRPHPPILIGGGKPRMLRLAGREADIVSLLTTSVATGTLADDPSERLASSVDEKLGWIRQGAGQRFDQIELSLIPTVILTEDREASASTLIRERGWTDITVSDVLEMPSVFIGTLDEIIEDMHHRRERYGFSYYVFSDEQMENHAPIVSALSGT
jgi:probable F420-dependent oxidoreductase